MKKLIFLSLLMSSLTACNLPTQTIQEKQRYSLEQISMSTKATADILGKSNKGIEGVDEIVSTLNTNFKNIPEPKPFEFPDWLKYLLSGALALMLPVGLNHGIQQGKGIFGLIGKIFKKNK